MDKLLYTGDKEILHCLAGGLQRGVLQLLGVLAGPAAVDVPRHHHGEERKHKRARNNER
jgi:hypothetical protein